MEHEQLEKRVEWLDKERRENLATINSLIKRIDKLEGKEKKSNHFIKDINSDLSYLTVQVSKIDEHDEALVKHRTEVKTQIDKQNDLARNREKEAKKRFSADIKNMKTENESVIKEIVQIENLSLKLDTFQSQIDKFSKILIENDEKMLTSQDLVAGASLKMTALDDELRIANNQGSEIAGELNAFRKKIDEHSSQIELGQLSQKKMGDKWGGQLNAQTEKIDAQHQTFEEIQNGYQEQKTQASTWNKKIEDVSKLSKKVSDNLLNLDEAERSLKNAREGFQGITDQIERRINEITEIQRLGDERYRQEWVTFKSDQQKRWTNQSISQEEQHKLLERQSERIETDLKTLTADAENLQEIVNMMLENSDKRMSTLMSHFRDWLSESEKQSQNI